MNTETIHTAGLIEFRPNGDANSYALLDNKGNWWLSLLMNGEQVTVRQEANLRRLAACWNACDGVSTETLEGGHASWITKCEALERTSLAIESERNALRATLAPLAAVVKAAQAMLDAFGGDGPDWLQYEAAALADAIEIAGKVSRMYEAAGDEPEREPEAERAANDAGPYHVMIDHEQSAAECATLEEARTEGRRLAAAEPLPCTFSIQNANGDHVEDIPGRDLSTQIKAFDASGDARG